MKQNQQTKYIIEGILAILIIIGLIWFFTTGNNATAPTIEQPASDQNSQPSSTPTPNSGTATNILSEIDTLAVSTQLKNSQSVIIDNVNLSQPSFIAIILPAISEDKEIVLATSKLLSAGEKQDLEISLGTAKLTATEYVARIYRDNGDKKFNKQTDSLIEGSKAMVMFRVK